MYLNDHILLSYFRASAFAAREPELLRFLSLTYDDAGQVFFMFLNSLPSVDTDIDRWCCFVEISQAL